MFTPTFSGVRRKISLGCFIQWNMVVIFIWCSLFVTSQYGVILMFPNHVLAKFVDIICIIVYTRSPQFMCHWTEYKISVLQVTISEENTLNATTQQFITAKISGCALKQGSKTRSPLRQSNLQLQNEAALMSCRIRAVEHRSCAAELPDAHPGLQGRILLSYTRIENAYKVRKSAPGLGGPRPRASHQIGPPTMFMGTCHMYNMCVRLSNFY